MAMDKTRLGEALAAKVIAKAASAPSPADEAKIKAMWVDIADEIIKEMTTFMQTTGTANVVGGSSAGVHPTTVLPGGVS